MKTSREYKKFRKRQLCLFKVIENIAKTFKGPTLRANCASLNSLKTWPGPTWRAHWGELHCKLWGSHGWFFFVHPHPPLFFIINITTVILRLIIIPFQLLVYHVWEEPSWPGCGSRQCTEEIFVVIPAVTAMHPPQVLTDGFPITCNNGTWSKIPRCSPARW